MRKKIVVAAGCAVLVSVVAVYYFRPATSRNPALAAREKLMEKLGVQIAQMRPNGDVMVLSNPFTKDAGRFDEKSQFERAAVRGLKKGLGDRSDVTVVFPEIRAEYISQPELAVIPPDSRTPLSFVMKPDSIQQLADKNPERDVIVSLVGLPIGIDLLKIWDAKDPRAFALLLPDFRILGNPPQIVDAFRRGKVLAAVFEEATSGQPIVVTSNNIVTFLQGQAPSNSR